MANLYIEFKRLIPEARLLVGTVTVIDDGGATIELPDGGIIRARGSAAVGDKVFVRDGVIEGLAPNLTVVEIEI